MYVVLVIATVKLVHRTRHAYIHYAEIISGITSCIKKKSGIIPELRGDLLDRDQSIMPANLLE